MNTKSGSETPSSSAATDFTKLTGDDKTEPETKKDSALAALEGQLQAEKDARMEERFIWVVICVILIDVIWLRTSPNATFPIVILILELIALLVLARRMGVHDFVKLIDRILYGFGQKGTGTGP
jgi:hypothetical protein